ncbi:MAG: hypothetical protein KAT65_17055 [Methanophagales archaeon]|nr:hypothetical protein [Methanophagales archaeon]
MKRKMEHEKCLNCEHIPCANLSLERDELDGGELYILNESIKQKKIVPCQPMTALYSCCMLCQTAYKTLIEETNIEDGKELLLPPLLFLTWQFIYDLKASAFLALTAHYRTANQILRPVIENILVGLYFEERLRRAISEEKIDQAWSDFDKWADDKYRISEEDWKRVTGKLEEEERKRRLSFGFLIEWLNKENVLTGRGKERFEKIQGQLNKYLHPYFKRMDIGEEKCSKCPATTRYDENRYYEWLEFFQNMIDFIIETMLCYYPSIAETADAKEAVGYLKNLEALEKELGIPMIKSEYLKDRIAQLPDIDELFGVK